MANTHPDIHLYDSELQGLARRNYQGGMPIQLLSDAFLYEPNGEYFHTIDGRFAKILKFSGTDASQLNNDDLFAVSGQFGAVLNKWPYGSSGQLMRHTHRDIRQRINQYAEGIDPEAGEFAIEIANSIMKRQGDAAVSPNGFFGQTSQTLRKRMLADALQELE